MKLVCISDTHSMHRRIPEIPDGDVLVHAGDSLGWNRAQGTDHSISGISAVVSGHIGTDEMVQKGNQLWIDTLAKTGRVPLMPAHHVLDLVAMVPRND